MNTKTPDDLLEIVLKLKTQMKQAGVCEDVDAIINLQARKLINEKVLDMPYQCLRDLKIMDLAQITVLCPEIPIKAPEPKQEEPKRRTKVLRTIPDAH